MKCIICDKEIAINSHKFCSQKCYGEYYRAKNRIKLKEKNCPVCGIVFMPKTSISNYCSRKCGQISFQNKRNKKNGNKKCQFCGKLFDPYTSLDKFCSANCRISSQKSKRSFQWNDVSTSKRFGENNPAYRNGNFVRGRKKINIGERIFIKHSKEIKQLMLDEKGFVYCEYCNTSNSLRFESHHLIYRSEKPEHENLHKKDNLLVLCIKCHNEFHKHKSLRNEIVKLRHLEYLFGEDILDK